MDEKFNTNAKVEQLTKKTILRIEEEKALIVQDPLNNYDLHYYILKKKTMMTRIWEGIIIKQV